MSLPVTAQWYWYVFSCVMESTLNCWQFLLILLKLIVAKKKKKTVTQLLHLNISEDLVSGTMGSPLKIILMSTQFVGILLFSFFIFLFNFVHLKTISCIKKD